MCRHSKRWCRLLVLAGCLSVLQPLQAQKTTLVLSNYAGVATGSFAPFWMQSNVWGRVSERPNSATQGIGLQHTHTWNPSTSLTLAGEWMAMEPRYRTLFTQQLYAQFRYHQLSLHVGQRQQTSQFDLDPDLSSGDLVYSQNSRPYPEVAVSLPTYVTVPFTRDWLQCKGSFSVGCSLDDAYLADWTNPIYPYVEHVRWHRKSLHLKIQDQRRERPFYVELGAQHVAQWGGTSLDPDIGTQPHGWKDFVRVFFGMKGGADASWSDRTNVLGNHTISYDIRLGYVKPTWEVQLYHQHISSDKSGLELQNGRDGLWGGELKLFRLPWLQRILVEYLTTRNQTGPFHFIDYDHDKYGGVGGGADNYYNNGDYKTGNSYFNRGIGSPLLPGPIYNRNGKIGFENNRVRAFHLGAAGAWDARWSYRVLMSYLQGWGLTEVPYLHRVTSLSFLTSVEYRPGGSSPWQFGWQLAGDTGDFTADPSYGLSFQVTYTMGW